LFSSHSEKPRHDHERKGSQLKTKTMGQKHWTKRGRETGEFMEQKKSGKFKSVRRRVFSAGLRLPRAFVVDG
jgi:hypothetical protein